MHDGSADTQAFDAWSPGLDSDIPERLMPSVTLFRPGNSTVDYRQASEIAEFCGLAKTEVVAFTAERLIVHELLVRVSADLYVPDGPNYEDLGISLRGMVDTIYKKYALPDIDALRAVLAGVETDAKALAAQELQPLFAPPPSPPEPAKPSLLGRLFGKAPPPPPAPMPPDPLALIEAWTARLVAGDKGLEGAVLRALIRILGAVTGKRGRLVGDLALLSTLAARMVCNDFGSAEIGRALAPHIAAAVAGEGYYVLPAQDKPMIMNVKGASAAGKSTIRPQQMRLAKKLDVPWKDFAVISPDYWRKYLLDYDSLGADFKYAAMLTGQELEVVDKKLDRHMADKAARRQMSHLLIDRFRFDSFVLESDGAADSKLLTRFGDTVFMFFIITAPAATVERAWQRGIKTGRYKAVDDLLFHNIEAYTGMPELFFSWALSRGKKIHYEFLDNNVPAGARARTVAFGWNGTMTILDVAVMLDIDRYRKVNTKARCPADIHLGADTAPAKNTEFLKRCAKLIPHIRFADYATGHVYGEMAGGIWLWQDRDYLSKALDSDDWKAGLDALGWDAGTEGTPAHLDLSDEKGYTLGLWAPDLAKPAP